MFFCVIDNPGGLEADKITFGDIDPAVLPANKTGEVDVDQAPTDSVIVVAIIHQPPGEAGTFIRAAIDETDGETALLVLTPDAERDAVDFRVARINRDVRCQRRLKKGAVICLYRESAKTEGGDEE